MLREIVKIANRLDSLGLTKEADILDAYLSKSAEVATLGAPGATYSEGLRRDYSGSGAVRFYKAKPSTISEFNAFLGGLVADIGKNPSQTVFSPSVLSNPPSRKDSSWNEKTGAAFAQYAMAAGMPEAGKDWASFAKKNGYEPTMFGIYKFWENTIGKVLEKISPPSAPVAPPSSVPTSSPEGAPQAAMSNYNNTNPAFPNSPPIDIGPLKRRIYQTLTGGSGIQIGAPEERFFSTLHGRVARAIEAVRTEGARTWFSQNPKTILPDVLVSYDGPGFNENTIDQFLANKGIVNPEIVGIYKLMLEAYNAAKQIRAGRSSTQQ